MAQKYGFSLNLSAILTPRDVHETSFGKFLCRSRSYGLPNLTPVDFDKKMSKISSQNTFIFKSNAQILYGEAMKDL